MKAPCIDKITQGFFDLVRETKESNESLIKRSKVLDSVIVLSKSLQLHTQRRLTGKPNADPDATALKLFADFKAALEVIK
jgi:hypothetical protein